MSPKRPRWSPTNCHPKVKGVPLVTRTTAWHMSPLEYGRSFFTHISSCVRYNHDFGQFWGHWSKTIWLLPVDTNWSSSNPVLNPSWLQCNPTNYLGQFVAIEGNNSILIVAWQRHDYRIVEVEMHGCDILLQKICQICLFRPWAVFWWIRSWLRSEHCSKLHKTQASN